MQKMAQIKGMEGGAALQVMLSDQDGKLRVAIPLDGRAVNEVITPSLVANGLKIDRALSRQPERATARPTRRASTWAC